MDENDTTSQASSETTSGDPDSPGAVQPAPRPARKRAARKKAVPAPEPAADAVAEAEPAAEPAEMAPATPLPLFQAADPTPAPARRSRRAASRPAGPPAAAPPVDEPSPLPPADATRTDTAAADTAAADTAAPDAAAADTAAAGTAAADTAAADTAAADATPARRRRRKAAPAAAEEPAPPERPESAADSQADGQGDVKEEGSDDPDRSVDVEADSDTGSDTDTDTGETPDTSDDDGGESPRRRRRRGGRGRRGRSRSDEETDEQPDGVDAEGEDDEAGDESRDGEAEEPAAEGSGGSRRRRRRRRRSGGDGGESEGSDDPPNTVTRVREPRRSGGDVAGVKGSTRLEAKKQRRREGRDAGRRRGTILTEAEFLARRESVDRVMVVRESDGRTQIAVLEDGVLVEHYVARRTQTSTVGNVYLGKVQNVLPSMEAAFVDIGKGRNAVLYAGEVNWDAAGLEGQPRRIEHALKSGESVLAQVTKDPIGHKGARLTSQVSLAGRYLVYVPRGSMTGISRKLPDTERSRLKKILRDVVPEDAGVIVRTAAEGASESELERDVARLKAQWEDIERKSGAVSAPNLLYGEPDLAIRVVRDIFNEDFGRLVISGDEAWDTLDAYVSHVAPDLRPRLERWTKDEDVFAEFRIDEQIAKAMDRKVWLPSGGSLVIDRTEAMTVVDVNTGKFTGAGGNLEETVTKNNLEAAEEIVRQLRLRDIGGIIVVDFIDMVLESNRDLVLRRLLECLGRDRTKHQVAEVTSLGLVQMTRKRVGQGLLEVFSEPCDACGGRGLLVHEEPVERRPNGGRDAGRSRPAKRVGGPAEVAAASG